MPETIISKRCPHCKQIKSLSEFHKDRNRRDGLGVWCKICHNAAGKARQQTEAGKQAKREYQQSKRGRIIRQEANKRYAKTAKGKANSKQQRIKWPNKYHARTIVSNAILLGQLVKPSAFPCNYCHNVATQYHHPDYSQPLAVTPVCVKCHTLIHNGANRAGRKL